MKKIFALLAVALSFNAFAGNIEAGKAAAQKYNCASCHGPDGHARTPAARKLLAEIYPHYYVAAEQVWGKLPADRADKLVAELAAISENATRAAQVKV